MLQTFLRIAAIAIPMSLGLPGHASAQDRRGRTTPGLVLETGARHAMCDILQFTPDGNELLSAGDDKVVRIWPVGKTVLDYRNGRILRWPIFREQRGSIWALAQSPDDGGKRVAIGGFGAILGLIYILDAQTGDVLRVMDRPRSANVAKAMAWSPDGRHLVFGSDVGEVSLWDLHGKANTPVQFAGTAGKGTNRVRQIAFLDASRFVYVTEDGWIHDRDVRHPRSPAPKPIAGFHRGELMNVAISADNRWVAAASQNASGEVKAKILRVELFDLKKLLATGDKAASHQFIDMPLRAGSDRYPMAVAFDAKGEKLAVGMQEVRHLPPGVQPFARSTGGLVHVWSLKGGKPALLTTKGLDIGSRPDMIAFRPGPGGHASQLAVAGGPNNEVRLWDFTKEGAPLATVRSPGSNLWAVAFSANGKYMAWKDRHNPAPLSPNDRGSGPWRVFTLEEKSRRILPASPPDFALVAPVPTYEGWHLKLGGFRWRVVGPGVNVELSEDTGLYPERLNQIPRCYTFLPPPPKSRKPPRLAIGHMWGVSIYDLNPDGVRLARVMAGHESEVMALAPSADGRLLLTAAHDQTIACWSLEDWPAQAELGASFSASGGKLTARIVNPGSPAWEVGLTDGDEVVMAVSRARDGKSGFVYDPEKQGLVKHGFVLPNPRQVNATEASALLAAAEPARELIFVWRHAGKEEKQLTTVRQRPLWRFFPTRKEAGNNWILWRWRDYYYDTNSAEPERLLGWQVNPEKLTDKPAFYPLANVSGGGARTPGVARKGFHNPDKVWKFVTSTNQAPDKVIFPDLEPPEVRLEIVTPADAAKKQELVLKATVRPHSTADKQKLRRVTLWLDDFQFRLLTPNAGGVVEETIRIPLERLRLGRNELTLSAYNNEGARGQHSRLQFFDDPSRGERARLHALCIGIDNYEGVKNFDDDVKNLRCSESDAKALVEVFQQHKNSKLYRDANVKRLIGKEVTRSAIISKLREIAKEAKSDDWVVLFLSGHGMAEKTEDAYKPGTFAYVCANADEKRRDATMLSADDLTQELGAIACRKLILMDACHSGSVLDDPVRALNQDGAHFLIFAACKADETAIEPNPKATDQFPELKGLRHGLFTEGLLFALGRPESLNRGARRSTTVTGTEVADRVKQKIDELIGKLQKRTADPLVQTPVFEPRRDDKRLELNLFCQP